MNDYMYCKINNGDKIYVIESIEDNIIKARNGNTVVLTNVSDVTFVDRVIQDKKSRKYNIELNKEVIPNEIMLRHLTKGMAIDMLDKYIDQAFVAKLPLIKIIHGKQGGILRTAVHDYLSKSPFISSYRLGDYHEGGVGVTIVILNNKM